MKQKSHLTPLQTVSVTGRTLLRHTWEDKCQMKDCHSFRKNKQHAFCHAVWKDPFPIQPDGNEEVYMISPQAPCYVFKVQNI